MKWLCAKMALLGNQIYILYSCNNNLNVYVFEVLLQGYYQEKFHVLWEVL